MFFQVPQEIKSQIEIKAKQLFSLLATNPTFNQNLTPYLHILTSHLPGIMKREKILSRFSQQSAEHCTKTVFEAHQPSG